jgi:DNA-binding MarR family transcriptional regulator
MTDVAQSAMFAFDGLDRIFHEKARLGIVTSLASHPDGLRFVDLKQLCGLTDGNLSRHLQILADAGYVVIDKTIEDRRTVTRCWLSDTGQGRFAEYIAVLEQVLLGAKKAAARAGPAPTQTAPRPA